MEMLWTVNGSRQLHSQPCIVIEDNDICIDTSHSVKKVFPYGLDKATKFFASPASKITIFF